MTPERWRQITGIFHAALERDAADRPQFVASRCGDDSGVRREVEAMLAAHGDARGLGDGVQAALDDAPVGEMTLAAGTRIGPYEIVSLLDVGGMGAVYRARDITLNRDVAIKVLLPEVAEDADRLTRFAREARVLAAMNHSNIAQIYGVEEWNPSKSSGQSLRALVMELVEGATLGDRIARGPLAIADALPIARQIAEALETAHEHGIVHRDLKPANIKVRPDGTVKVLDFGLAKALEPAVDSAGHSGTSSGVTQPGLILGTAAYMAPEQARGLAVDRRADLWGFGCVLFEMLTGRRVFGGDTLSDVLVDIIEHEPDWSALPARTPPAIRRLLRRCLEKNPKRRLDSAAAARFEIDDALTKPANERGSDEDRHRRLPRGLPWVAAIGLAIAIPASVSLFRNSETPDTLSASQLQNARRVTFSMEYESAPTWSPDGTRVAYQASDAGYLFVANHDIWVTQLGSGEPLNLTNSPTVNDRMPSWSPDGREIAFFSNQGGQWAVHIMPALGGSALSVLPLPSIVNSVWSVLRWSQDGTTLFVSVSESPNEASQNVVYVLPRSTLTPARVHLPDHDNYFCGDLSVRPDGGRFAYVQGTGGNSEVSRLWTTPSTGGKPVPLTDGFTNVRSPNWSKDGRTVFYVSNRGGSMDLWRQQVTDDGTPLGEPLPLTSGVGMQSATFSGDGTKLAYTRGGPVSNLWRVDLLADRPATWADARQLTSERAYIEFVDVDTRGEWLAFSSDRRGNQDLWRLRTSGGEMTPIRTDPTPDWNPRWSPDASQIAFYAFRSGHREIWVMPSRGGPAQQLTFDRGRNNGNPRWSPDGTEILFASWRSGRPGDWLMNAKGGEPRPLKRSGLQWLPDGSGFVDSEPNGTFSRVSKDGSQSVVLPSTGHERGGGSFQVARDGQSIYYVVISGPDENQHLWKMSLADGRISQLTKLDGKRGRLGNVFAADDRYLYVIWHEDEADIWVMDVVKDDGQRR